MPRSTNPGAAPLVSVLIAAHDAAETLLPAVRSVLRQTIDDLELVVVDDCSSDETHAVLEALADPRLVVVRNSENLGLARSLNRGLELTRGRYVARLDADDVALPHRLERQLAALRGTRGLAIVGSAVLEIDAAGLPGDVHVPPVGIGAVRWHALFGSPFFHPTVVLDRAALDRHELRYDERFGESEDFDLWTRLLACEQGDNLAEPLVLRRVHRGQATKRRSELQRSFQRQVALRAIAGLAPRLSGREARLAWELGASASIESGNAADAVAAYLALVEAFVVRYPAARREVQRVAARRLARVASHVPGAAWRAARLDPLLPIGVARERARRRRLAAALAPGARRWQASLATTQSDQPVRVVVVSPEPTPYRSPLFDRVAARPEVDLTVVYQARTVAGRAWEVEPHHRSVFLEGVRVPGARRLLRHDYAVTPGVFSALGEADPQVVVVSGWSTFASQAAVAWCRRRGVPYLLLISSHDDEPRASWRRRPREALVRRIVGSASGALVLGTLSRRGLEARGLDADRIGVFANTVDVEAWGERAVALASRRPELRATVGALDDELVVLSVARLSPEKELGDLIDAVAEVGQGAVLVIAGSGPERGALEERAATRGVRLVLTGDVAEDRLAELYVAADVFALLSSREPWAVVVNEAAASGLPLVLSDRVGAAHDLLVDDENGKLVAVGDVAAAAVALRRLALDRSARDAAGAASRRIVAGWGYEPSVESFVAIVRAAASR